MVGAAVRFEQSILGARNLGRAERGGRQMTKYMALTASPDTVMDRQDLLKGKETMSFG
jgi:hypothetical protein